MQRGANEQYDYLSYKKNQKTTKYLIRLRMNMEKKKLKISVVNIAINFFKYNKKRYSTHRSLGCQHTYCMYVS